MSEMTEYDKRHNMLGNLLMTGLSILAASALVIACWAGFT